MNKKFKKILTLSLGLSSMVAVGLSVASCTTIIKPESGSDGTDDTVLNVDLSEELLKAQDSNAWTGKKFVDVVSPLLNTPEARDVISKAYVDNLLYEYFSNSKVEEDKKVFDDAVKVAENKYKSEEEKIKLANKKSFDRAFQLQFLDKNGGSKEEFIKREISSKLRTAFTDKFIGTSGKNNLRYGMLEKDEYKIKNPFISDETEINAGKRVTHSIQKVSNVNNISNYSDIVNSDNDFGWGILKEQSSWTDKVFSEIEDSDKKKLYTERSIVEFQKKLYEKWFNYEKPVVVKTALFKSMNSIVNGAEDSKKEAAKQALEREFKKKYTDSIFTDYDKLSSLNIEDKDNEIFPTSLAYPLFRDRDETTGNDMLDDKNNNSNIYYDNWKELSKKTNLSDDEWATSSAITMDSAGQYIRSINASSSDSSLNSNGILNSSDNFASEFSIGILHSLNNTANVTATDNILDNFTDSAGGTLDKMYKNLANGWTLVRDSFGIHAIKAEKQTSEEFLTNYMKAVVNDKNDRNKWLKTEFKLVEKMKKYFEDNQDEFILEFFNSKDNPLNDYVKIVDNSSLTYSLDNNLTKFVNSLAENKRYNRTQYSMIEGIKSKLQLNISKFNIYQFNRGKDKGNGENKGIYKNIFDFEIPGSGSYEDYYLNTFNGNNYIKPSSWEKPVDTIVYIADIFGVLSNKEVVFGDGSSIENKNRKSDTLFFKVEGSTNQKNRILNLALDNFRLNKSDLYRNAVQNSFEEDLFKKVYKLDNFTLNSNIKYDEWMKEINNLDTMMSLANSSDKDLSWYGKTALLNSKLSEESEKYSNLNNNNMSDDLFVSKKGKEIRDKHLLHWLGQTAYRIETKNDKKVKVEIKYGEAILNNLQNILLKKLLDDPLLLWVNKKESTNPNNVQLSTGLGNKYNPSGIFGPNSDFDSILSKEKYVYNILNSENGFVGTIDKNNKNSLPSGLNIDDFLNSNIESLKANDSTNEKYGIFPQFRDFESVIKYIDSLQDFDQLNSFTKFLSNKLKDFSSVDNKFLNETDVQKNKFSQQVQPILDLMKDDKLKPISSQISKSLVDGQKYEEISVRNLFNNLIGNGEVSISNTKEIDDAKNKAKLLIYTIFKRADGSLKDQESLRIKDGANGYKDINLFNSYVSRIKIKNNLGKVELSPNLSNTDYFTAYAKHIAVDDILDINYEEFKWDGVADNSSDLFKIVYDVISDSKVRSDFLSFYLKDALEIKEDSYEYIGYSKEDIFERSIYDSIKDSYLFKKEENKE